jgi:hypothetical protein
MVAHPVVAVGVDVAQVGAVELGEPSVQFCLVLRCRFRHVIGSLPSLGG